MPYRASRHMAVLADHSGSTRTTRQADDASIQQFLAHQAQADIPTTVALYQFDHIWEPVYEGRPITRLPAFTLRPRGDTALVDAIALTIARVREYICHLPANEAPDEVVIVIHTDGTDNASHRYTAEEVNNLMTMLETDFGWTFMLLPPGRTRPRSPTVPASRPLNLVTPTDAPRTLPWTAPGILEATIPANLRMT
ncbi:hypothetical protein [Nonomuraea sp. KM90]|uniref:hypothetical protein n=1 Tax=Nonomuraea sp. KM90 TaxID=3457428 RepID=UPI003FCE6A26